MREKTCVIDIDPFINYPSLVVVVDRTDVTGSSFNSMREVEWRPAADAIKVADAVVCGSLAAAASLASSEWLARFGV